MAYSNELYRQVILEHNKNPRNFRAIESAQRVSEGNNPLCGDRVTLYVNVENDHISDIAFQGSGCAISKASASLMTEALKGKTVEDAKTLFLQFQNMVTDKSAKQTSEDMGKLAVFAGIRDYPTRVKCATLAWHAAHAALLNHQDPITTEGETS
ncbi:MAG: SUF system NifU family Fe-S cluster assembly protein [Candidatus Latescibacteria bacterium]|nr:SUF system NifU family Fe-S cluster assembly protein [Candidatus Latescibacterota bacterium]